MSATPGPSEVPAGPAGRSPAEVRHTARRFGRALTAAIVVLVGVALAALVAGRPELAVLPVLLAVLAGSLRWRANRAVDRAERALRNHRADAARRHGEQAGNEARGRDLGGMHGPF